MNQHRYLRLHIIVTTVKRTEGEINRTVERGERARKVNNFTAKQKRTEEEAAMRYYVQRALQYGCKSINLFHVVIKYITKNHC
jgi:hypothetical protein